MFAVASIECKQCFDTIKYDFKESVTGFEAYTSTGVLFGDTVTNVDLVKDDTAYIANY